jgi:hypothetical protein
MSKIVCRSNYSLSFLRAFPHLRIAKVTAFLFPARDERKVFPFLIQVAECHILHKQNIFISPAETGLFHLFYLLKQPEN